ncbi:MAG: hypothetical protein DRP01_04000 [Archaeoglobales archaeon]|nr:MAG: hypothetical protein DRP01_04000 [Archaeoglobales archaeon]
MRVIALVGLPLSGKTTASRVAESMGIPVVCMGDVVREEAKRRNLPMSDEVLGKIANELREREGMDAIARRCISIIRERGREVGVVVVDGVRGIDEVRAFKRVFEDFILIAIDSPVELRLRRALKRGRSDDVKSLDELRERDRRELSWNLSKALEIADFTVENSSSLEEFREKVRGLLEHLARRVEIEIETTVNPTEDLDKVILSVRNIFPDAEIQIEGEKIRAKAWELKKFRDLLRRQRILDTARTELIRGRCENETVVFLNKQAAYVGRLNFADEDAILSPIKVRFKLFGIPFGRFIDYVAPQTRDGKPVSEIDRLI